MKASHSRMSWSEGILCACPPDLDPATAASNHAPDARFDDAVIPDAATLLAELAVRRLSRA